MDSDNNNVPGEDKQQDLTVVVLDEGDEMDNDNDNENEEDQEQEGSVGSTIDIGLVNEKLQGRKQKKKKKSKKSSRVDYVVD